MSCLNNSNGFGHISLLILLTYYVGALAVTSVVLNVYEWRIIIYL